jgi:hypothetical protein
MKLRGWWVLAVFCIGLVARAGEPSAQRQLPRKIYGHYMGCFCCGTGAIQYHATSGLQTMDAPGHIVNQKDPLKRALAAWASKSCGGTYRNFGLAPYGKPLSLEAAADLEIRRAMRIGMDGFTFDAWAGGAGAIKLLDLMFKLCEEKNYSFELTITPDCTCFDDKLEDLKPYTGNGWVKSVKWLLDKHGKSPKLARRDGKPLVLGYGAQWAWVAYLWEVAGKKLGANATKAALEAEVNRLRTCEEGWKLMWPAYQKMEQEIGQPVYWEMDLTPGLFFHGVPFTGDRNKAILEATRVVAQDFPAIGQFLWDGPVPEMAKVVVDAGREWCHPMKLQYENYGYFQAASPGLDWVRSDWQNARDIPSTLIQHITWNDYHECTNLSPGYNTRYAYYDLTGYFIRWWKTGKEPAPDHDRIYVFSHKYAHDTKMFPFKAKTRADNEIEVLTILPQPARLRMPRRTTKDGQAEWDAPAGMSFNRFALTAGPVAVELLRGGKVEIRLDCPEPVGDRPFRQDTGKVAISTECQRHWEEDFGKDVPFFHYSEYGDADNDGLPNWFEMLWFGKFGDMSTATCATHDDDPDDDGKTNLQEYREQTDPTTPPAPTIK